MTVIASPSPRTRREGRYINLALRSSVQRQQQIGHHLHQFQVADPRRADALPARGIGTCTVDVVAR